MLWKPWRDETTLYDGHSSYERAFIESGLQDDEGAREFQKGRTDMDKAIELIRKAHLSERDIELEADEEQDDGDLVPDSDLEKRLNDMKMPVLPILYMYKMYVFLKFVAF